MDQTCEEHIAIPVSDSSSLTPYVFYHYLVPTLRACLLQRKPTLISLDMTGVANVSPLVLPNLIVIGKILSEHFGRPGNLILSTRNVYLLQFLKGLGFFRLLDQLNFFQYDANLVLGLEERVPRDLATIAYLPPSDLSPGEILHLLLRDNKSIGGFIRHFPLLRMAEVFAHTVGELAHNSSKHGRSCAVISAYGGPKLGLQCAVSDCGVGYYSRLLEEPEHLLVYREAELCQADRLRHFKAIIEAVCRRLGTTTYGVSNVIRDIAGLGGTTRVHTLDTQVIFTQRNQAGFGAVEKDEDPARHGRELAERLLGLAHRADSFQSSPVRIRESRLAGVHIEFEIPPSERAGGGHAS